MRRSVFLNLDPIFGPVLPSEKFRMSPSFIRFNDGKITYRSIEGNTCIEQEFKGRLGYLHHFSFVIEKRVTIEVQTTQKDIYVVYPLNVTGEACLTDLGDKIITRFYNRRAFYLYLPPSSYFFKLEKGRYQFFGFYFDIGILDGGAGNSYHFLKTLLDAYRNDETTYLKSDDFEIGHLTTFYIKELCSIIKYGDIDKQVSLLEHIKNLVKLSLTKIKLENQQIGTLDLYIQIAETLIERGVENHGILFSLNTLSEVIPLNSCYLNRIFKKKTGHTLSYQKKIRVVELAKKLLKEDMPVSSVSGYCGFSDVRSFRRLFIKFVGTTPDYYRKKHFIDTQRGAI
ncbi:helix-turn-helix domain-containing protein [Sphingobacterium suaedae]|uniref:Helix-turn-helix domain-containing protein n=1 Tax=Sphingobacterium suaedae TaxID=1686402 RepID=A0ABW5KK26_9SPHI